MSELQPVLRTGRSRPSGRRWTMLLALAMCLLPEVSATQGLLDPLPVRAPEKVRWLRGYLRIDTSNPPGHELDGARYLAAILEREGIEHEIVETAPGRGNLIARLRGNGSAGAIVLHHHIDVVPAPSQGWKYPPFSGAIVGPRIHGRGAVDCKGPGMAQLAALVELKRRGVALERDVVLLATADEERGGKLGLALLLERRPELLEGVVGVLGEGGGNLVAVDKMMQWGVAVAEKRPLWLRVVARGNGGHGSMPAADAPSHRLLRGLAELLEWKPPLVVSELLDRCAKAQSESRPGRKGEILRDLAAALAVAPDEVEDQFGLAIGALVRPTVAIGKIHGSESINVLPSLASAEVDVRLRPEDDDEAILRELQLILARHRLEVEVIERAPKSAPSPASGELYDALERFFEGVERGSVVAPIITPGFTDCRYFRERGIPAYGFLPIKVNYYDSARIHGTNELLRTDFFEEGANRMAGFLESFCGRKATVGQPGAARRRAAAGTSALSPAPASDRSRPG